METLKIKKLNKWANVHTHFTIDLLRIILGVFLISKGASFLKNPQLLDELGAIGNFLGGMFALHYIVSAHIVGGIMIVFGLLTRWSIWAQLPILIGAVIINLIVDFNIENLLLTSATLLVCVFFLIYGSGKNSADYLFKMGE